ncbi:FecCD family ABC transporter permease [Blastococcus tunisiensis]|uniref:Iron complex transport system permease protein n=1 Tax=Blastococcus tunisiensis TaxID=1798228 RepID=A0A1I2AIM5_9ACTN|nr:iron ABC transporter permease [Blastococcus sp. DSM 46838]SFE42803.1 iron complex transport system permease protein [Blastococcus sp. DSM 46838]
MTDARPAPVVAVRPVRLRMRRPGAVTVLAVALPIGIFAALMVGSSNLTMTDALAALVGHADGSDAFVVRGLRLPRVVTAVAVGAALGASGVLLQGLLRNPLGSPDVMGVTAGASLAAVIAIGAAVPPLLLPLAAATGAGLATALLHLLTTRAGAGGTRIVLAGVGIHAAAYAAVTLVVARLPMGRLGAAEVWLAGSLHARNWTHATAVLVGLAVGLPAAFLLVRRLSVLELGDELAVGAGVALRRTRIQLLAVAAVLAGVAVAVAGPIGFVALGAPHIARRIVGPTSGVTLAAAAIIGALLVVAADVIGQRVFAPIALPAGMVTAVIGAPYLLWLLHRWGRR